MSYSVVATSPELAELADRAASGEEVVIVQPSAAGKSFRLVETYPDAEPGSFEWLIARRDALPFVSIDSVELMRLVYEEDD